MGEKPFFGQKQLGERLFFYEENLLTGRKLAIFVQNLIPLLSWMGKGGGPCREAQNRGGRAA